MAKVSPQPTDDPMIMQEKGISDHTAVGILVAPRPQRAKLLRPIPREIFLEEDFAPEFAKAMAKNPAAHLPAPIRLATVKANMRTAATHVRNRVNRLGRSSVTAMRMITHTIARAVMLQDVRLARVLLRTVPVAKDMMAVTGPLV